jgi:hypothetical protein
MLEEMLYRARKKELDSPRLPSSVVQELMDGKVERY